MFGGVTQHVFDSTVQCVRVLLASPYTLEVVVALWLCDCACILPPLPCVEVAGEARKVRNVHTLSHSYHRQVTHVVRDSIQGVWKKDHRGTGN